MSFSLRVCRHCRKPVGLKATACPHCRQTLMDPHRYQLVLVIMAFLVVLAYSGVAYGGLKLHAAKAALHAAGTCEQPFYSRDYVADGEDCQALCVNECAKREKPLAYALLISRSYAQDRSDVLVSCECTCGTCR